MFLRCWATICKTVRPMLSDRCLSVCPVCPVLSVYDVGVLWPNSRMDEYETWHAGGPRPWPWGPSPLSQRGTAPQFSAHICCGRMAGWMKTSLGIEAGLGKGDVVLDGDPPLPQKGDTAHNFPPMSVVAKRLYASGYGLVRRWALT